MYFLILLVYYTPAKKLKNCIIFSSCKCCSPIIRGCIRVYILRVARVYLFNKVHCPRVTTLLSRKYYTIRQRVPKNPVLPLAFIIKADPSPRCQHHCCIQPLAPLPSIVKSYIIICITIGDVYMQYLLFIVTFVRGLQRSEERRYTGVRYSTNFNRDKKTKLLNL